MKLNDAPSNKLLVRGSIIGFKTMWHGEVVFVCLNDLTIRPYSGYDDVELVDNNELKWIVNRPIPHARRLG